VLMLIRAARCTFPLQYVLAVKGTAVPRARAMPRVFPVPLFTDWLISVVVKIKKRDH
jgi:hypothetical protein